MQLASALGATCYTEDAFTAPGGTEEYAPPTPSCPGPAGAGVVPPGLSHLPSAGLRPTLTWP